MNKPKVKIVRAFLQIFTGAATGRMLTGKPFWRSFSDGLIGEGIFGDLPLPDSPTKMFKSEE
jgi:hypothetical protein